MTGTANDTATGVVLTGTGDSGSGGNGGGSSGSVQPTSTGATGGEGGSALWYTSVEDTALRSLAETKGWKNPADALKSYKELETAFSTRGEAPKAPKDASEYKFNVPTDIPEGAYNEAFAGSFRKWAHDAGLSTEQAAKLHDAFVGYAKGEMTNAATAQTAKVTEQVTATARDLETAWGKMDSPAFKRNLEMAQRAMRLVDPAFKDALVQMGAIVKGPDGREMVANATVVKSLAKFGEGMYAEDRLYGDPASDKNPFDDKTLDLAMQGRLVRESPDKAALLIRAAGKEKMFSQFLARHASSRK